MITGAGFSRFVGTVVVTAEGESCFYCGQPASDPAIVWSGFTAEVFLHPRCALELTTRLIRDVHEYQCKENLRVALVGEKP